MQIGNKSIVTTLDLGGTIIRVQANKNYGIIDMEPRIDDVLSSFQGRQINNQATIEYLMDTIATTLKLKEQ